MKDLTKCKQYTVYRGNEKVYDILAENIAAACQEFIGTRGDAKINKRSEQMAKIYFSLSEVYVIYESGMEKKK